MRTHICDYDRHERHETYASLRTHLLGILIAGESGVCGHVLAFESADEHGLFNKHCVSWLSQLAYVTGIELAPNAVNAFNY